MAKVGRALVDGATGSEAPEGAKAESGAAAPPLAVKPQFFKALVGKGHPEFSSPRQQVSAHVARSLGLSPTPCAGQPWAPGHALVPSWFITQVLPYNAWISPCLLLGDTRHVQL